MSPISASWWVEVEPASLLSDADLHGLVDGHIGADRRADVLRRAAASPRDRALIESWQDQNDLIRAAFAGVENEPLPRALDLRTPPQLRAVPLVTGAPPAAAKAPRWGRIAVTMATATVVAAGLAGSWYVAASPSDGGPAPFAGATVSARATDGERMLADRTVAALAFGETDVPQGAAIAEPPPVAAIPDLSQAGFTFTGAEARGLSPKTVIFRYRNGRDERVAIGARRASGDDSEPAQHDGGFTWNSRHVTYAVYGTVGPERLHAIAATLISDPSR